jgi:hypothetical protein
VVISASTQVRGRAAHGVGGTSDNVDDGDGVEEGLASDDIPEGVAFVRDLPWIDE